MSKFSPKGRFVLISYVFIPTGVVLTIKSLSSINSELFYRCSKKLSFVLFEKLLISSFKELIFREIIVIFEKFKLINPCITDLAAPPEPSTIDFFSVKLRLFRG